MSNAAPELTSRILDLLALLLGPPAVRRRGAATPSPQDVTSRGRTTGRVAIAAAPSEGMSIPVRNFLARASWGGKVLLPAPAAEAAPPAAAMVDIQREVDLAMAVRTFFSVDWSGREVIKAAVATQPGATQPPPSPVKSAPKAPLSLSTADVFGEFAFD
jgi:hypothetical protein